MSALSQFPHFSSFYVLISSLLYVSHFLSFAAKSCLHPLFHLNYIIFSNIAIIPVAPTSDGSVLVHPPTSQPPRTPNSSGLRMPLWPAAPPLPGPKKPPIRLKGCSCKLQHVDERQESHLECECMK